MGDELPVRLPLGHDERQVEHDQTYDATKEKNREKQGFSPQWPASARSSAGVFVSSQSSEKSEPTRQLPEWNRTTREPQLIHPEVPHRGVTILAIDRGECLSVRCGTAEGTALVSSGDAGEGLPSAVAPMRNGNQAHQVRCTVRRAFLLSNSTRPKGQCVHDRVSVRPPHPSN